ncbi:alternative oxidase [Sphingopyxis italica]|uniref:alternative oxidase n=1 Tax=Sphingopyxis italica TaxID=1129133 RepID=UPI0036234746
MGPSETPGPRFQCGCRDSQNGWQTGSPRKLAVVPAPKIARDYWGLSADATLRDVVLVVRADEAHHRDVNHGFANELAGLPVGPVAEFPPHVTLEPNWKKAA